MRKTKGKLRRVVREKKKNLECLSQIHIQSYTKCITYDYHHTKDANTLHIKEKKKKKFFYYTIFNQKKKIKNEISFWLHM